MAEFQIPGADIQALLRQTEPKGIAPWPQVDRYPTVLGQGVSIGVLSNAMRLATYGYRQPYVDVLNELLEREPHCQAVLGQRILAVAGGRYEITPAECEQRTNDAKLAQEMAKETQAIVGGIDGLKRSVGQILYALFYGVGSLETLWDKSASQWQPSKLNFIHSRRLSYPDVSTWDLHIVDQGGATSPKGAKGIRLADYPGKFIVHTPLVRGDYPTREGLGRALGFYMIMKQLGVRGAAQAVERFAKGWPIATYTTSSDVNAGPRAATDDDIAKAQAAVSALGIGSLSSATLPDSIKVMVERFTGGITQEEFVGLCNNEMTKLCLGQTHTTSPGANGNRSASETAKEGTKELNRFDADSVAEDLERDLIRWIVRLNYPDADLRLSPKLTIHAFDPPNPDRTIERVNNAVMAGMPVDADAVADDVGIPLIPKAKGQENNARRMVPIAPLKPIDIQSLRDFDEGGEIEPPTPPAAPGQSADDALPDEPSASPPVN